MPSNPMLQTCLNTVGPSPVRCSTNWIDRRLALPAQRHTHFSDVFLLRFCARLFIHSRPPSRKGLLSCAPAARSSSSAPRMTILSASSGNDRCNALPRPTVRAKNKNANILKGCRRAAPPHFYTLQRTPFPKGGPHEVPAGPHLSLALSRRSPPSKLGRIVRPSPSWALSRLSGALDAPHRPSTGGYGPSRRRA